MNASLRSAPRGFTLVEVMIAITLMAILMAIAVPSFRQWAMNAQIRTAAESITNGLQRARAEAVARNTDVAFILGDGTSWEVQDVSNPNPPIDFKLSSEGSQNVTVTALAADLATEATTITYNNLGAVVPSLTTLRQVDLTAAGGTQNLRVQIGIGGNARTCDPTLTPGSSPRAC